MAHQGEAEGESSSKLVTGQPVNGVEIQSASNKRPSAHTQYINNPPNLPFCSVSKRYAVAWFTFLGFVITFGIRCNISVAMVKMIEPHESTGKPEFDWSSSQIPTIDASFIYGYILTQIPGGFLSTKYPANKIFGIGIVATAALNLFIPMSARLGYQCLVLIRFVQGIFDGVTLPACYGIFRWWVPPLERTRLASIALTGTFAGNVIGLRLSGILAQSFGWHSPFYLYGVLGILWFITWLWAIYEKPSEHPTIRPEELEYIEKSIRVSTMSTTSSKAIPWKSIFSSMPFWAICFANVCYSWTFYVVTITPWKYFLVNYKMNVNEMGILGTFPMLLAVIILPFGGILADSLRTRTILTTTAVRKLFNFGGFAVQAGLLLLLGTQAKDDTLMAIVCVVLAVGFSAFAISAFNVNHLDIAPRYASLLMGISNCVGMLSGFLCHIVVEDMTSNETVEQWQTLFIVTALINVFGIVIYTVFASGQVQPWAEPEEPPPPGYWETSVLQHHNQPKNDTLL